MNQIAEKQYCQSCGMPLRFDVEEYLGTNADHTRSGEYCYYCLKEGGYTVDIPMNEMVDIWVKYTDKYNWYSGTDYTPQELKVLLNKRLPTLKRWLQKEQTECAHYEAVSRVKAYIDQNLFCDLIPECLAGMANLSFYHFRKVFRQVTGENVGTYIQRLRLEYIAHLVVTTGLSVAEICEQTCYQTKFSLAKAFRKHFGITISGYRTRYGANTLFLPDCLPEAKIKRMHTQKAICLEVGDAFRSGQAYAAIWKELILFRKTYLKQSTSAHFASISQDNPFITPVEQRRFYIGIMTDEAVEHKGKFLVQEIPGGMYAVFRHRGSYARLPELYQTIYEQWFPQSKYCQKCPLTFEVYVNDLNDTAADDLLTEIYIPIDN